MDYFNDVLTSFPGHKMFQLHCCLCRVRKLSDFIKNILISVLKMNKDLTGLEYFQFYQSKHKKCYLALSIPSSMPMLQIRWMSVCNVLHGYEQLSLSMHSLHNNPAMISNPFEFKTEAVNFPVHVLIIGRRALYAAADTSLSFNRTKGYPASSDSDRLARCGHLKHIHSIWD